MHLQHMHPAVVYELGWTSGGYVRVEMLGFLRTLLKRTRKANFLTTPSTNARCQSRANRLITERQRAPATGAPGEGEVYPRPGPVRASLAWRASCRTCA